jgi:hypothetical protein
MAQTWAAAPDADNLIVGKGSVWINRFDNAGNGTGLQHLGNVDAMEITTEDDIIQKFSSMTKDAPLYKKITRRRNVTVRLTLSEFHPYNLALITQGEVDETYAQPATAVVGEVLTTSVVRGAYYKVSKLGPYTAPIVPSVGVLGTDYEIVDPIAGIIHIFDGVSATIVDGSTLTVGYTPTAYTAGAVQRVKGGTQNTIEGSLLFVGDPSAGPKMMVEIWKASFTPDGALGLISEEFADLGLVGGVLADPVGHPGNQLYQVTYLPA